MFQKLQLFMQRPCLYEGSTSKFWDDPHISQGMLEAHLAENVDAATRNLTFVRSSVQWIFTNCTPINARFAVGFGVWAGNLC